MLICEIGIINDYAVYLFMVVEKLSVIYVKNLGHRKCLMNGSQL